MADRQAQRRGDQPFDWVVLLIPLTLGILTWMTGLESCVVERVHKTEFPLE